MDFSKLDDKEINALIDDCKYELLDRIKKRESEFVSKTSRAALIKMVVNRIEKMQLFMCRTNSLARYQTWVPEYSKVLQIISMIRVDRRTPDHPQHKKPTLEDQDRVAQIVGVPDLAWSNKQNEIWAFFQRPDVTQEIIVAGCELYFLEQTMEG